MVTTATSSHVDENTNSNLHPVPGKMIDRGRAGKAVAMERKHEWAVILAGGDGTRLKSLACPGAARGFEGNRHPMERSRGTEPRSRIYPIGRLTAALDGRLLKAFAQSTRVRPPFAAERCVAESRVRIFSR